MIDVFKPELGARFKVVSLPDLPDPIVDFFYFPYYLFFNNVDVLHLTGNSGIALWGTNCKTVLTVHDVSYLKTNELVPWSKKGRQIIGRIYRKFAVPLSAKSADRIVTVSEFAALDIQHEFRMVRAPEFVYHGVDLGCSRSNENHSIMPEIKNKYLVVGGSDPQKNIGCVVSAFSIMYDHNPTSCPEVFIIGMSRQEYKINKYIPSNIHFLGYQDYKYVQAAICSAKCIIVPSYYESFGLPLIESLFNFTPVICSDRGALKEIGGDAPIYFNPAAPESLINAITEFECGPNRISIIEEWVFNNSKRFDWEKCAMHYLRLYYELCGVDSRDSSGH
jgi:glycosyltransferase involved in cell wall biosynthesis